MGCAGALTGHIVGQLLTPLQQQLSSRALGCRMAHNVVVRQAPPCRNMYV